MRDFVTEVAASLSYCGRRLEAIVQQQLALEGSTVRITHPEFDVNDEALIDADPMTTFHALVDEVRGTTRWWRPHFEAKPRNPAQFGEVGSIVDVQIRWIVRPRFSARVREAEAGRRFRVEFFRGAFVGSGDWSFEPAGQRTLVQFRWAVRSNQWRYSLAAPFVDLEAIHSKVVHAGFKGLNEHVREQDAGSRIG